MASQSFVKKFADVSTEEGFQFRFHCDRCDNGFLSTMLDTRRGLASRLLGGLGRKPDSRANETPRDQAFRRACVEMRPLFMECLGCGKWVCKPVCWNAEKGKCKDCAPTMGEGGASVDDAEAARVRAAERAAEQARAASIVAVMKAASSETAACPKCGAANQSGKFCSACGSTLAPTTLRCSECGTELAHGAKFCPECGMKL
jgi:hypothetical protein